MPKTIAKLAIENRNEISSMQKKRNSSIVTIVGQEHTSVSGDVFFCLSPDLVIISELKFKIIATEAFTNVVLDDEFSLGWSGGAGANPNAGPEDFFDLLSVISGTPLASTFFDGAVHKLTFTGNGTYKVMLYAKYSCRNR